MVAKRLSSPVVLCSAAAPRRQRRPRSRSNRLLWRHATAGVLFMSRRSYRSLHNMRRAVSTHASSRSSVMMCNHPCFHESHIPYFFSLISPRTWAVLFTGTLFEGILCIFWHRCTLHFLSPISCACSCVCNTYSPYISCPPALYSPTILGLISHLSYSFP